MAEPYWTASRIRTVLVAFASVVTALATLVVSIGSALCKP